MKQRATGRARRVVSGPRLLPAGLCSVCVLASWLASGSAIATEGPAAASSPAPTASTGRPASPVEAPVGSGAATPGPASTPAGSAAEPSRPAPAMGVTAADKPNDEGKKILVRWALSPDDGKGAKSVIGYELLRSTAPTGPFQPTGTKAAAGVAKAEDEVPQDGVDFYYQVRADSTRGSSDSAPSGAARSSAQWFKGNLVTTAVLTAVFCGACFFALGRARRGAPIYIRPIGGIDAIDEAIGRATEMGKPILFVPGLWEASDSPTLAAFSILSRVARKVADYQCRLIVPCYYAMVMVVAREVVKSAYTAAGRPDAYQEKDVFYLTQEQFAYVAGINGIMLRERPATNFYLGAFFAESLMLAETGFQAGSIQIAGTDQPIQIPFFVAACDYTLIGEELYAAAAYLSDDPRQKATLKAQDYGKAAILAVIAVAAFLWFAGPVLSRFLPSWLPSTALSFAKWFAVGAV